MITLNGQKMGKSLGNAISLEEFFTGAHPKLEQAYSPMTIRFFMLQAHYRSTLDFSNEALKGSEKGLVRLLKALEEINSLKPGATSSIDVDELTARCDEAMMDDLNSPTLIAHLFDGVKWINGLSEGRQTITAADLEKLKSITICGGLWKVPGRDRSRSFDGVIIN